MNKEQLSVAVGEIRDDFVAEAAPKTRAARFPMKKILTSAAVLFLAVAAAFAIRAINGSVGNVRPTEPNEGTTAVEEMTAPSTQNAPEQTEAPLTQAPNNAAPQPSFLSFAKVAADLPEYKNADEFHYKKETILGFTREDYADLSFTFFENYANELLLGNGVSNTVTSPLNAFFSLAVLAKLTDGASRDEILNALDVESMEELEKTARALWLANYYNDTNNRNLNRKLIFSNSLWVNENNDFTLSDDLKSSLKDAYFASLFKGDPNDQQFREAYKAWLSITTDGLLDEQLSGVTLPEDLLLQLESTLLCRLTWSSPFSEADTAPGLFRGQTQDATVSFMHKEGADPNAYYFTADGYTVFGMPTTQADAVFIFLLPDEGVSLESVLRNGALAKLFQCVKNEENLRPTPEADKVYLYNVAVPKFDLSSDFNMKAAFEALGITSVLSPETADFTPLTGKNSGLYLNSSDQNVRLQIDENGISAASRLGDGFGFGDPEIVYLDFKVDRPFAFALLTHDGVPLFTGTVSDLPNEE